MQGGEQKAFNLSTDEFDYGQAYILTIDSVDHDTISVLWSLSNSGSSDIMVRGVDQINYNSQVFSEGFEEVLLIEK